MKIDIPGKEDEELLQLRLKCDTYDVLFKGKNMPEQQVIIGGRLIHRYKQKLQSNITELQTNDGPTHTTTNAITTCTAPNATTATSCYNT